MRHKVLIADDEPVNLEMIGEYFAESGYEPALCSTGSAAWNALANPDAGFDLIILEQMMRGVDGISLLKRAKADPRLAPVPVIMQTMTPSAEQLREGFQAGAYGYLSKPYDRESLLSIARAALNDAANKSDLHRRLSEQVDALQLIRTATFEIRTLEDASRLAAFLARLSPHPDRVILGLSELLINGIEHGNLGISYAEKAELRRLDTWADEVRRRSALAENRDKRLRVELCRETDRLSIRISDDGTGFDWRKYLHFDPARAFDPNGRGIALARLVSFDELSYVGCGNVVVATVLDRKTTE